MTNDAAILEALQAALRERGAINIPAAGLSMGGRFAEADSLVISRIVSGRVPVGGIAVFRQADRWFVHRVLMRWRDRYWTKGDAVWTLDRPLPRRDDLIGEVTAVVRGGTRCNLVSVGARCRGRLRAACGWIQVALGLLTYAVRK